MRDSQALHFRRRLTTGGTVMKKILSLALVAVLSLALAAPVSAGGEGEAVVFTVGSTTADSITAAFIASAAVSVLASSVGSSSAQPSRTRTMPIRTPIPTAIPTRRTRSIRTKSTHRRRSTSRRRRSLWLPQSNGKSATPAAATICKAMG